MDARWQDKLTGSSVSQSVTLVDCAHMVRRTLIISSPHGSAMILVPSFQLGTVTLAGCPVGKSCLSGCLDLLSTQQRKMQSIDVTKFCACSQCTQLKARPRAYAPTNCNLLAPDLSPYSDGIKFKVKYKWGQQKCGFRH